MGLSARGHSCLGFNNITAASGFDVADQPLYSLKNSESKGSLEETHHFLPRDRPPNVPQKEVLCCLSLNKNHVQNNVLNHYFWHLKGQRVQGKHKTWSYLQSVSATPAIDPWSRVFPL